MCTRFDQPNISRILEAIRGIRPRHRMRPDKLPLADDPARFTHFKNLNVETELGIIDFLSEVEGVGAFEQVVQHSVPTQMGDLTVRVLNLDSLIAAKQAANRQKDRIALIELNVIRDRRRQQINPPTDQ